MVCGIYADEGEEMRMLVVDEKRGAASGWLAERLKLQAGKELLHNTKETLPW